MADEVKTETAPVTPVQEKSVPAVADSSKEEIARLMERINKIEETNKSITEQLARANSDIAARDVELAKFRIEAETRAKDEAWQKQAERLPEANRTAEMRKLYESDKDAYLERVVEILSSGKGVITPKKAEGSVISASAEDSKTSTEDKLAQMGYFLI